MAGNRPTINDIARELGLSSAAVSFALNDRPGVSEVTRVRVKQAAEELGWRPNAAAKALSEYRSGAIGLVIARSYSEVGYDTFFLQLITGVEKALARHSVTLVLQMVETAEDEEETHRRWNSEGRVDGVILVDLLTKDPRPAALVEMGLPAVLAGGPDPTGLLPSVSVDDAATMELVLNHLYESGHRRVAHVAGMPGLVHTMRRSEALRQVADSLGVEVVGQPTDFTENAGWRETVALLGLGGPTAFIYDNELLALGGLHALADARVRVPDEVVVVSWEDHPLCRVTSPNLTAVARDAVALGEHSADLLLHLVGGGEAVSSVEPLPVIVPRASTLGWRGTTPSPATP